jgi:hypothetical protein
LENIVAKTMPTRCRFGVLAKDDEASFRRASINQDQIAASGVSDSMEFRVSDSGRVDDGRFAVEVREVFKVDRLNLLHVVCYFHF